MPTLTVNGAPRQVDAPLTIDALLAALGRDPGQPGVAVAVGRAGGPDRVVRRAEWAATTVGDGDRVEVITAAQGG